VEGRGGTRFQIDRQITAGGKTLNRIVQGTPDRPEKFVPVLPRLPACTEKGGG